ncbi:MAG: hypothetical protein KDI06_09300 [Calditrichaeota bacterium]|nr:hypothetical protein [Calditrichota bacterium]HQU72247.1 hypothetical protein [Calditrichia bacterium]
MDQLREVISDITEGLAIELELLLNQPVELSEFSLGEDQPGDGFILRAANGDFHFHVKTYLVDEKHEVNLLYIDELMPSPRQQAMQYATVHAGILSAIHIFKVVQENIVVDRRAVDPFEVESAALFVFDDDSHWLLYPGAADSAKTEIATDTDFILDTINEMGLVSSRMLTLLERA